MFEILGIVIALSGIGGLARGRGASPVLAGSIALAGWIVIGFFGPLFAPSENAKIAIAVGAWAWVAGVAVFLRFVVGASRPKPDGKWNCSNCRYLNNESSVICEACRQPWRLA